MPLEPRDPRVLLITGASSGIGRATAVQAARAGDHVVLVARSRGPLDDAAEECIAAGAASVLSVPTDVGDDGEVERLVDRVLQAHSRIDAVISCAGVVAYGRTEDVPAEVFNRVIRTNLLGSANIARHTLPVLRRQRAGTLLFVGSVIGHIAAPTMTAYAVSKWGVRSLARQLEVENHDLPEVRIKYVAPGGVDTPIYAQAANFAGFEGRPPPPAVAATRTAGQVLRRLGRARFPEQLSVLNYPIMFGFQVLPRVYDAIVGTAFPLGATDLTRPVEPHTGNVLEPQPEGNKVDGEHGSSLLQIVTNVRVRASSQDD